MSDDTYRPDASDPPNAPRPGGVHRSSVPIDHDVWRASASFGWLIGAALALVGGIIVALLALRAAGSDGGQRVGLVAVAVLLFLLVTGVVILLRALRNLRYRITDDAVVIEWFGRHHQVPLGDISSITFEPDIPLRLPRWEPFWPGYYVATLQTRDGTWRSWATQQPQRRVRLTTSAGIIAISPERPVRFIGELERRLQRFGRAETAHERERADTSAEFGATARSVAQGTSPPRQQRTPTRRPSARPQPGAIGHWFRSYRDQFRTHLLSDQISSVLLGAGVVLPFLMVAYLYSQYEGLPDQIPMRWNAANDVIEQTGPGGLWRFPVMAVVVLFANSVLASIVVTVDRYLARLLLSGVPLVQMVVFIALIRAAS